MDLDHEAVQEHLSRRSAEVVAGISIAELNTAAQRRHRGLPGYPSDVEVRRQAAEEGDQRLRERGIFAPPEHPGGDGKESAVLFTVGRSF